MRLTKKALKRGCNNFFVTLIPKSSNPLCLADYRPINMIGCITKINSKTLAEHLKMVISKVIGKEQTTFIRGHNIIDST